MIEKEFDVSFIADLALREKQIQQNYRPIIAVHKWFARRPGTLFRGLLLSEFAKGPLRDAYYRSNTLSGKRVADPFMGGGTPLIEANRIGCDVVGYDINPMAYWIVSQEILHLDLHTYSEAAEALREALEGSVGTLYRTKCTVCGNEEARVKYFLWVKTIPCCSCSEPIDLFPNYVLSANVRHPRFVFVCPCCGFLTEADDRASPGACARCGATLTAKGPAERNRCLCPRCNTENRFPRADDRPPEHRLFAIEYHCAECGGRRRGRLFKMPDAMDLAKATEAGVRLAGMDVRFVPDDEIPSGDETNRLHRWGYRFYREMFNPRQLLGLELSARLISGVAEERIRHALATNLSDLLRYQNMLCRYDHVTLKSLDIFSVHGFPIGLVQCESNFLGIMDTGKGACVGSGGWKNVTEKFTKAKRYCEAPFEILHSSGRKRVVRIEGERIGNGASLSEKNAPRSVELHCADAATAELPQGSLDAVFTDPPYFGNVQYAELMDFCYVWLRRLVGESSDVFAGKTTRNSRELTGNENMGRGIEHFASGLSSVFQKMAAALKKGAPFAFTYHHNLLEAYFPIAMAMLDAGLVCSASIPCPAEMGASIHISGTGSSIVDTVFVCRSTGVVSRKLLASTPEDIAGLMIQDVESLREGKMKPSPGDLRCIAYGHLIRLAVWNLRKGWVFSRSPTQKLSSVACWLKTFGGWPEVERALRPLQSVEETPPFAARVSDNHLKGVEYNDEVTF